MHDYENFLDNNFSNYNEKKHRDISGNISDEIIMKHLKKDCKKVNFENIRELDFNELLGGFLSASYSPKKDTKEYFESKILLEKLFNEYNINNMVTFEYETIMYIGRI